MRAHCTPLRIVLLLAMSLAQAVMPVDLAAVERTALTEKDNYAFLASVLAFFHGTYGTDGPEIKIFEIGGGDPAMNGAFIYVCITRNEDSFVWKTGLNVRDIRKITFLPGNTISLNVNEDYMRKDSTIANRKKIYSIRFFIQNDTLQDKIAVEEQN